MDIVDSGEILAAYHSTGPGVFAQSGLDDKDATHNVIKKYKEAYHHTTTLKNYTSR